MPEPFDPFSLDLEKRHETLMRGLSFLVRTGGSPLALLICAALYMRCRDHLSLLEGFGYFAGLLTIGIVALVQNWGFMCFVRRAGRAGVATRDAFDQMVRLWTPGQTMPLSEMQVTRTNLATLMAVLGQK